jgi:hypothetical protein
MNMETKLLGNKKKRPIKIRKTGKNSNFSCEENDHKLLLEINSTSIINSNEPDTKEIKDLQYDVESWSSYISHFHPKNILIDNKIGGPVSKWSVDFKSQSEYLFIKLNKTSIVSLITFGKFKDPTNLKEFKIFAGLDKNNMIEVLHSGLSLDNEYEPFSVNYKLDDLYYNTKIFIPCK